jgi:hypothetical protein
LSLQIYSLPIAIFAFIKYKDWNIIAIHFFKEKACSYIEDLLTGFVVRWHVRAMKERKPKTKCLSDEELAAFVDHCLRLEQKQIVEAHLSECAFCRKIVILIFKSKKAVPDPIVPPSHHF